jgi:hypothetical protein
MNASAFMAVLHVQMAAVAPTPRYGRTIVGCFVGSPL